MSERAERMLELFEGAQARASAERGAYLQAACGSDEELAAEVLELLAYADAPSHGLEAQVPQAVRASTLPSSVGSYDVESVLGEGGMGVVYRARHQETGQAVAIKQIHPWLIGPEALGRFEREARLLARLSHPSIVPVLEAGLHRQEDVTSPYLVMALATGTPIDEFVRKHGLSMEARLRLCLQLLEAVASAHQRGVIHRDLKPEHVLVEGLESEDWMLHVLDFGIARCVDDESVPRWTQEGQLLGTISALAPEQWLDPRTVDTRVDVYALGVLLFRTLAEQDPIDLADLPLKDALHRVRSEPPRRLRDVVPSASPDLEAVVQRALAKDRERRYSSVMAFADDVRCVLEGRPVEARTRKGRERWVLWWQQWRAPVLAAGVLVAITLVGSLRSCASIDHARRSIADSKQARSVADSEARRAAQRTHEARIEAQRALGLADAQRLTELVRREQTLWSARAERLPEMDRWLAEADALCLRSRVHLASLAEFEARAMVQPDASEFASEDDGWLAKELRQLVQELDAFGDEVTGMRSRVARRRLTARTLHDTTVEDAEELWDECLSDLAQMDGISFDLEPLCGLVPWGLDEETGRWLFWHPESGVRPRGEPGGPAVDESLWFIVVPAGEALLAGGAVRATLEPYLLAKDELTVAQWFRLLEQPEGDRSDEWLEPIRNFSYDDASTWLGRYELQLPTNAQWTRAAVAETTTRWWTGDRVQSLLGAENLRDQAALAAGMSGYPSYLPYDDGLAFEAPVGRRRANPFGFRDMLGNVAEWLLDCGDEREPARPGDGFWGARPTVDGTRPVSAKGGSFQSDEGKADSVNAWIFSRSDVATDFVGVRPARSLRPKVPTTLD